MREIIGSGEKRSLAFGLSWTTIGKILTGIVAVWVWLRVWEVVIALIVSVFLAVAIEPLTRWLESKRIPRWLAAVLAVLTIVALVATFASITASSLSNQAPLLGPRLSETGEHVRRAVPWADQFIPDQAGLGRKLQPYLATLARSTFKALVLCLRNN